MSVTSINFKTCISVSMLPRAFGNNLFRLSIRWPRSVYWDCSMSSLLVPKQPSTRYPCRLFYAWTARGRVYVRQGPFTLILPDFEWNFQKSWNLMGHAEASSQNCCAVFPTQLHQCCRSQNFLRTSKCLARWRRYCHIWSHYCLFKRELRELSCFELIRRQYLFFLLQ